MPLEYNRVANEEEESPTEDPAAGIFTIEDDDDESDGGSQIVGLEPLEIASSEGEIYENGGTLFTWSDPWFLSVNVSLFAVTLILLANIFFFYKLTGRIWTTTTFPVHWLVSLLTARQFCRKTTEELENSWFRFTSSILSCIDIVLFGFVYPFAWKILVDALFIEPDGTTAIEWSNHKKAMDIFKFEAILITVLRVGIGTSAIVARTCRCRLCTSLLTSYSPLRPLLALGRPLTPCAVPDTMRLRLREVYTRACNVLLCLCCALLVWCLYSVAVHLLPSWPSGFRYEECDSLDDTECALPFPSFHHMRPDSKSITGWRVNLKPHVFPALRGGVTINPSFINELDGFSTMAPILFYIPGLKEAHEAGAQQLQGSSYIPKSVTQESITFLVDVNAKTLVAHSAEIDYLDGDRPLVLVFPATPLKHNNHYALAVLNAKSADGELLSPTHGMKLLFQEASSTRRDRYDSVLIPALEEAAPWFSLEDDPNVLQLLFDFQTISKESQLGPIRAVRDGTLAQISEPGWSWDEHVRTNRVINHSCRRPGGLLARTIHAEMDVPWFLNGVGPGQRGAVLEPTAVKSGRSNVLGVAKFVVHIPCSVRATALDLPNGKPLRAVMEFGHGLFFSRKEASDEFLARMANDEGYAIIAMDWRGMSVYDLLVVVKTLMSTPSLFQAVRDNLIQGYANKYALQHFARNGMLKTRWFAFAERPGAERKRVRLFKDQSPSFVFYGISQGGILGAGYSSLSGVTGLIDRAILGVPGTPFALILSRSLEFAGYDTVMLLNFQNNRHVRIFLSVVQMAWDSTEASGVVAPPIDEPYPRMLLQAGLGDVIVPAIAAEALARGLNASTLPSSPRTIYGVQRGQPANENSLGPHVTLTELMYDKEFLGLPRDNTPPENNGIHICLRQDHFLLGQLKEFVNTGRITDPCEDRDCHRSKVNC